MKKSKVWVIVGACVAAALIIIGVVLLIKGFRMPDEMFDDDFEFEDFGRSASSNMTYFITGGFLIFGGVAVGAITLYWGIGHKVSSNIKEAGGLGTMIGSTLKDIKTAQSEYCPYCGSKLGENDTKCKNCGASVRK